MRNKERFEHKEYIIQDEFDEFMKYIYDEKVGFNQYCEMRKAYFAACSFILDIFINKIILLPEVERPLLAQSLINQIKAVSEIKEEDFNANTNN